MWLSRLATVHPTYSVEKWICLDVPIYFGPYWRKYYRIVEGKLFVHKSGGGLRREYTTSLLRVRVGSDRVRVDKHRSARRIGGRQSGRLELEQPERVAWARAQECSRNVERLLWPDRRPVAPDVHAVHERHALPPVRWLQLQKRVGRALHCELAYNKSTESHSADHSNQNKRSTWKLTPFIIEKRLPNNIYSRLHSFKYVKLHTDDI